MKIICTLPFKNERHYLPIFLKNVIPIVDKVIAIDDNSTDNSRQILESAGSKVKVYSSKDFITNEEFIKTEYFIRSKLLELAREEKATHYMCLDADETFTSNFVPHARKIISKLGPGQKLAMQWLAMWKTADHYRDDQSVWSNNFKDFVVCDDGKSTHNNPGKSFGFGRTPGENTDNNWLRLNNKYGAVLHFQFTNWRNFQIKQLWYRMSELIEQGPNFVKAINNKFSITLDDGNALVRKCPDEWITGLDTKHLHALQDSWHAIQIKNWASEYGEEYFRNLDNFNIIKTL